MYFRPNSLFSSLHTVGSVQVVSSRLDVYLVLVLPLVTECSMSLLLLSCQSCLVPTPFFGNPPGNPLLFEAPLVCLRCSPPPVPPHSFKYCKPCLILLPSPFRMGWKFAPSHTSFLYKSLHTAGHKVFHLCTLLGNKPSWNLYGRSLPPPCLCLGSFSPALCHREHALLCHYWDCVTSGNGHSQRIGSQRAILALHPIPVIVNNILCSSTGKLKHPNCSDIVNAF